MNGSSGVITFLAFGLFTAGSEGYRGEDKSDAQDAAVEDVRITLLAPLCSSR